MAVEHDDNHWPGTLGCDQAIEDPVRFAVDDPGLMVVTGTVLENQQRIARTALLITRRRINPQLPGALERFRLVAVLMYCAMRHILPVPGIERCTSNVQDAFA